MSDDATVIRVLIADDQRVIRDGLTMLVNFVPGLEVVGAAVDGADAIDKVAALDPDIVLMDLRMPGVDGVDATRAIVATGTARVVVLTVRRRRFAVPRIARRCVGLSDQGRQRRAD